MEQVQAMKPKHGKGKYIHRLLSFVHQEITGDIRVTNAEMISAGIRKKLGTCYKLWEGF